MFVVFPAIRSTPFYWYIFSEFKALKNQGFEFREDIMGKGGRFIQISNEAVLEILRKYYAENEKEIKKSGYFFE